MKIDKDLVIIRDVFGKEHSCYLLKAVQHNYPDLDCIATGLHYFDSETFDDIKAEYITTRKEKSHAEI